MNKVKFSKDLLLSLTTPKAVVLWSNLHAPNTKFNAEGVYDISVIIQDADFKEIKSKLEDLQIKAAKEYQTTYRKKPSMANSAPFKRDVDKETGEELPQWVLKAKMPAKATVNMNVTERKPTVVDSQLKPVPSGTIVGRGSIVKVNILFSPYFVPAIGLGISAKLKAVQIIELSSSGGADPLRGFSTEEGFTSSDVAVDTSKPTEAVGDDVDF